MHEPLEEVALPLGCVPPLVLELLVRLEVRAGADQLESFGEPHALDYRRAALLLSGPVATILLVGVDLFFRGKLEALLPGHRFVTSDSVDPPDLVFADIARVDALEVVDAWPDVPIVGFTNHTDKAGLQRAHAAGFDQVIVKSALVERAPELVAELVTAG
jgi:CheY-like chemotaxis protein